MKNILLLAALIASSVSCASITADVGDVCSSQDMSFPGVPVAVSVKAGERTGHVNYNSDMSSVLKNVSDIATVTVTSVSLNVYSDSDLSFLNHVKVTIHSTANVSNELVLSDAPFTSLNLPVSVDQDKLLALLKSGPVTTVFTGTGKIPTEATSAKSELCIGISAHGDKSIGDISK